MLYQVEYQVCRDADESVDRVVYNFLLIQCKLLSVYQIQSKGTMLVLHLLKFC